MCVVGEVLVRPPDTGDYEGYGHGEWLNCGCCGNAIRNLPDQNAHYSREPYPDDAGYGMCLECGGDPASDDVKKRMGWTMVMFCEARFEVIRKALNDSNKAKWDASSFEKKCALVVRLVEKGSII